MSYRTLLITHTDLDGVGSLILSKLFQLDITDYIFMNYDELYEENGSEDEKVILELPFIYDRIFVTDVATNKNFYDYLSSVCQTFGVFDHHEKTAEIADLANVYYSIEKSGTELFYDELKSEAGTYKSWDTFVNGVSAYDLWKLDSPDRELGENLNRLFFAIKRYGSSGYDEYRPFVETIVSKLLDKLQTAPLSKVTNLTTLLTRPELTYNRTTSIDPNRVKLPTEVIEQVEIQIKYAGYIKRQKSQVKKYKKLENYKIPKDIDYFQIHGISHEGRERFSEVKPLSLGQAKRIPGITPADITALMINIEKMKRIKSA